MTAIGNFHQVHDATPVNSVDAGGSSSGRITPVVMMIGPPSTPPTCIGKILPRSVVARFVRATAQIHERYGGRGAPADDDVAERQSAIGFLERDPLLEFRLDLRPATAIGEGQNMSGVSVFAVTVWCPRQRRTSVRVVEPRRILHL
jgi:hypothetical protein